MRTLIKQSVYGGRIDSDFDQEILNSFVDSLFTPVAYNVNFQLVTGTDASQSVTIPEGTKMDQFIQWVQSLPEREPPLWLSLPPSAESVIAVAQGNTRHFHQDLRPSNVFQ